jgi:hypothetical protein
MERAGYIHLNQIRTEIERDRREPDCYQYSGYSVVMGKVKKWQEAER